MLGSLIGELETPVSPSTYAVLAIIHYAHMGGIASAPPLSLEQSALVKERGEMYGYKVVFQMYEEVKSETFKKFSTACKWEKLVQRNGYEVLKVERTRIESGARV